MASALPSAHLHLLQLFQLPRSVGSITAPGWRVVILGLDYASFIGVNRHRWHLREKVLSCGACELQLSADVIAVIVAIAVHIRSNPKFIVEHAG